MSLPGLRRITLSAAAALLALASAGCSTQPVEVFGPGSDPVAATSSTLPPDAELVAGHPMPQTRCQLNRDAGPLVFLTNRSRAAAAGIIEVLVAEHHDLYRELCLDVQVMGSFASENYSKIAADEAQFAAAGSFSEIADFAGRNDARYVVLSVDGRVPLDELMVRPGALDTPSLDGVRGHAIGVHGAITPAVAAMLDQAGITAQDYSTVPLASFDPPGNLADPDIIGISGSASDAAVALAEAGVPFDSYRPSDHGVAGSFGVIFTNATLLERAPTAVEDFMRATMRGLEMAVRDPAAAADIAFDALEADGNDLGTTREFEHRRWATEAHLVLTASTSIAPLGVPLTNRLTQAVATYAAIGYFGGIIPDVAAMVDSDLVLGLYDTTGEVVWPAPGR